MAFDKVPHKRLLGKLEAHEITENALRWIDNWLSNRRQMLSVDGEFSEWATVKSGVLIILINEIDEDIVSKFSKFAYDSKVAKVVNNLEDAGIQRDYVLKL